MSAVLTDFLKALRASDVRVSTAEGMDAVAALAAVGFEDRTLVKNALSQALAKSPDDKLRFDACFEHFFAHEDMQRIDDAEPEAPPEGAPPNDMPPPGGGGSGAGGLLGLLESGDRAALQLALAQGAAQARVNEIRLFTQRGQFTRRTLEAMGLVGAEEAIERLEAAGEIERARRARRKLVELREEVIAYVERQMLLLTANAGTKLREETLARIPLARAEARDFKLMQGLVRKLAKRLIALHSRRRKIARRGQLDVRHTLRRNIEFDGLLFDLVWKRKKIERPKVVAVCDVSGSVAAVSRFLLLFLYSLTEVLPKIRAFVFSNQLAEVTSLFETLTAEDAVAKAQRDYGWGSTDYGRALAELEAIALDDIDHRTTVLVLGDARSNYGNPGHASLRRIHERARRVIWLNPEPRTFWNTGDSEMRRLGAACDRVESCRSLAQLEAVVTEILRTAV
ncbi:MAG: VWA domain-containing protein [Gammaproteobacteria bacterium]|nr:VWA domain-containing protein [Gammaproteobacteria bacterium]MBI5619241.1 VWA domain-containing protein [Gammaproteobacteria bacterium]